MKNTNTVSRAALHTANKKVARVQENLVAPGSNYTAAARAMMVAFSLVELMISLVVISCITAAFTPIITKKLKSSNVTVGSISQLKFGHGCDDQLGFSEPDKGKCLICNKDICMACKNTCPDGQYPNEKCMCKPCDIAYCGDCSTNHSSCSRCKEGYLISGSGDTVSCTVASSTPACAHGYADGSSDECIDCPKGQKCEGGVPYPCTEGKLCEDGIEKPCPEGKLCTGGEEKPCPDDYCTEGHVADCPSGNTCENGLATPCDDKNAYGYTCKNGKKESCKTINSDNNCTNCDKTNGTCTECDNNYKLQSNKCEKCPDNEYCEKGQNPKTCYDAYDNSCVKCNVTECTLRSCSANQQLNEDKSGCTTCPTDKYCPDGTLTGISCNSTSAFGSNCEQCNSTGCTKCTNGMKLKTSQSAGTDGCTTCDAGKVCDGTSQTDCSTGHYCSGGIQSTCTPGYVCNNGTRTACDAGTWCDASKGHTCLTKATDCKPENQPEGKYCNGSSCSSSNCTSDCKVCASSTKCSTCKSSFLLSSGSCSTCPSGATCNGSTSYTCPSGKYDSGNGCTDKPTSCAQAGYSGVPYYWNGHMRCANHWDLGHKTCWWNGCMGEEYVTKCCDWNSSTGVCSNCKTCSSQPACGGFVGKLVY